MSLENVKAFYEKLSTDEAFRAQIQGVKNKNECSQIVKDAGYNFTQEEFKDFTSKLLELSSDDEEIRDLDQKELAAVLGGLYKTIVPPYGTVWPEH